MKHLRPCSETPKLEGETAVENVANLFEFQEFLGSGFQGLVIRVTGGFVVKILTLNRESIEEIRTQCLLDHPSFLKAYGWLYSKSVPREWLAGSEIPEEWEGYGDDEGFLFIFMEEAALPLDQVKLTYDESKAVLFLILHGLYVGRRDIHLQHGDLHDENIMLDETPKPVVWEEDGYRVKSRYWPKVIDFGVSTTKYSRSKGYGSDDFEYLAEIFPDFSYILELGKGTMPYDYRVVKEMLDSPWFAEFRMENCTMCQNEATHRLEGGVQVFCGYECLGVYWVSIQNNK